MMDVLEPELIWVNGHCYRFYENSAWKNIDTSAPYMEDKESVCSDEESESSIEIVPHNGRFKHAFYVPKIYYSYIIGAKGITHKKLENETKTTIDVPRKGKDGSIVITAADHKAIISARHRIDLLIEASRKKIHYTHFLSIPLNKKEIIDNYNSFKDDVLKKYDKATYNIDESLFQNPSKLHLTVGMLKLLDDNEKKQAIDALLSCKEKIIDPFLEEAGSINIQLQGVACMNDDPTEVKVLFAQVSHNEKLQELVDKIADYFVDIGLKEKEYETIKLHATLMNTSFKHDYHARFKEKFNASDILKVHKDTLFGETTFNQIDISELHNAIKDIAYAVTESDIMEINDGISTIFCSAHTLKMNSTFNAFQMAQRPEIASKRKHLRLKKSMSLPDDTLEYWGFYLLNGASVALSVCSRFQGASILVVKGEKNLHTCGLLEHNVNKEQPQDIFISGANKQVKIIYESNAQEIESEESMMVEPNMYNTTNVHIPLVKVSFENPVSRNEKVPVNTNNNNTWSHKFDENLMENAEALYDTAASYIKKHIGDRQKSLNFTRNLRHLKHRKIKKNKNKKINQERTHGQKQVRKLQIQKLKEELHSNKIDRINSINSIGIDKKDMVGQEKLKDKIDKRFRRSRDLVKPPSLLDQGIRHGGNADKNFTSSSNEASSISSFETGLLNCYGGAILFTHEFAPSAQCTNISYLLNGKHAQADHHVEEDGYYYYIFYSDNDIVSNDIYAIFDIYKPTFQYENVTKSCINVTECSFFISPLSSARIIVEIPTKDGIEHNEMDDISILISICQPRMNAYLFFPIAILFLILGCAFI
ncbi:uncharacterized protein [Anoplolepis gracilipes]|uniref:uncharacterized protein n=1 Tax=Anoplolepis gracilipes TaxID=354296 RepID=UPI003BA06472